MDRINKELKSLKSHKNDLEKRLETLTKGKEEAIQKKIQTFLTKLSILESSLDQNALPQEDYYKSFIEIQSLKASGEQFQSKLHQIPMPSKSREDEILENLSTLKEISQTILSELRYQNQESTKSLKSLKNNEDIIIKAKSRLNKLENFLDCLPTSCLIITLILTFLSTILILSIF